MMKASGENYCWDKYILIIFLDHDMIISFFPSLDLDFSGIIKSLL